MANNVCNEPVVYREGGFIRCAFHTPSIAMDKVRLEERPRLENYPKTVTPKPCWACGSSSLREGGLLIDPINPSYYKRGGMEVKDIIKAWELGYNLGTAITYILRAGKKTADPMEDLLKAQWFLNEAINE